jgi:hypothetical protein
MESRSVTEQYTDHQEEEGGVAFSETHHDHETGRRLVTTFTKGVWTQVSSNTATRFLTVATPRYSANFYASVQGSSRLTTARSNGTTLSLSGVINGTSTSPWSRTVTSYSGRVIYLASWGLGVAVSINYGKTFNNSAAGGLVLSKRISGIACSSDGSSAIVVSFKDSNLFYRTSDTGLSWSTVVAPTNLGKWQAVTMTGDGNTIVVGEYGGYLFTSSNSGATFTQAQAPWNQWQAASAAGNSGLVVALGTDTWSGIWISRDFGVTFMKSSASHNLNWQSVATSIDGSFIAACSAGQGGGSGTPFFMGGVYFSTDFGASWVFSTKSAGGSTVAPYWIDIAVDAYGQNVIAASTQALFMLKR